MTSDLQPVDKAESALPKAYDPSSIEQRWAEYWVREHLFDVPTPADGATPDAAAPASHTHATARKFTQLLPPPNVTGRLHIGHMLNQTEMDILTRWHRMSGDTTLWVPGTDHAGIATQMMVERQLLQRAPPARPSAARPSGPASGSGSPSTATPSSIR